MVITRYIRRRFPFLLFLLITTNLLALSAEANPAEWRSQGWSQTDFSRSNIDLSQIMSGGPPKDGIPAIDNPQFLGAREEQAVAATEPVVSLKVEGIARAYPLRILMWHEIVNDKIGGTPVTITYCPLCNLALDTRIIAEGRDIGNVVVQRITAQGPVDIVHDITFAFVFRTFHPGAKIIQN